MSCRLESVPAAGGGRRVVIEGAEQILAATGGHLIFKQGEALFAVRCDASTGAPIGAPTRHLNLILNWMQGLGR